MESILVQRIYYHNGGIVEGVLKIPVIYIKQQTKILVTFLASILDEEVTLSEEFRMMDHSCLSILPSNRQVVIK